MTRKFFLFLASMIIAANAFAVEPAADATNPQPLAPLSPPSELQEIPVAIREQSGVLCFHSR